MAGSRAGILNNLTRRHGIKIASAVSVEDCCLAVGEVVGHEHIMSASRMNSVTVIFLSSVDKANELVETGIVIDNLFTHVLPLSMPSKKVLLSNIPPFISNEMLVRILSRYGKLVSPIKMIPIGGGSPLLKHVVSFRRFVYMILKDDEDLDLSLHLKVDEFDYVIYVTTDRMKCFKCGLAGHLVRACPGRNSENRAPAGDTVNCSEPVTAGALNAALSVTEAGAMGDLAAENPPAVEAAVIQVNCHKNADEENMLVSLDNAETLNAPGTLCDGIEVEAEQIEFKIPSKRKNSDDSQTIRAKKSDIDDLYSDGESSDSSVGPSQNDFFSRGCEVDDIKLFLKATKNKRGICVSNYFSDTNQFVDNTRLFMSEGLFTNREIYRLKKIVTKLTSDKANEGGERIS